MKAIYAKYPDGRLLLRAAFDYLDPAQMEEHLARIPVENEGAEAIIVEDPAKSVEDIINGHLRPLMLMEDISAQRVPLGLEDFRANPDVNNQYSLFLAGMAVLSYNVDKTDGETFASAPDFGVNYRKWCFVRKTMIMAMTAEELVSQLPEWNKELFNYHSEFQKLVDELNQARYEQMMAAQELLAQQAESGLDAEALASDAPEVVGGELASTVPVVADGYGFADEDTSVATPSPDSTLMA